MVAPSFFAGFLGLACLRVTAAAQTSPSYCPVFYNKPPTDCRPLPETFLAFSGGDSDPPVAHVQVLEDAFEALVVLQEQYYEADFGTWPSAIDWTAAVVQTVMTGMLSTLSKSLISVDLGGLDNWKAKENLISSFYAQVINCYFGQDILSIRGQAYDDILWVVLGWIETIKFVDIHTALHYPNASPMSSGGGTGGSRLKDVLKTMPWHGQNWVNSFAHRARIFWNLGSRGWDTRLCNGGMIWNPRLKPYKNAITNQLWISASSSMYRYFPGDNFTSPWLAGAPFPDQDPLHLASAIEGYKWLMDVGMVNRRGLFVDGYHINDNNPDNTRCDVRDEMVYTYNQGVLLTGQRELWAVSGSASYLEDGHSLIQSVITSTGWDLEKNETTDDLEHIPHGWLPPWRGLGRGGILEEQCDPSGTCSQDGQAFKGVFFHHLASFCAPLDPVTVERGMTVDVQGYQQVKTAHTNACKSYLSWVKRNALAALATRDEHGRFGMWWGAGLYDAVVTLENDGIDHDAENTTDYRNLGTPEDGTWGEQHRWLPGTGVWTALKGATVQQPESEQQVMGGMHQQEQGEARHAWGDANGLRDPNSRGRGRTVETQMGGLALIRAYWEMSRAS